MVRVYLAKIEEMENGNAHERQSKAARRLLRQALLREYPELCTEEQLLRVEKDARGKPFLADYPAIQISLSHSGELVSCALADTPVGVDVEQWRERRSPERVAKRLHSKEQELLRDFEAGSPQWQSAFYGIWVQKESFLKAIGEGLRVRLDAFCTVSKQQERTPVRVEQDLRKEGYFIREYALEGWQYSLAVCSEEQEFAENPILLSL